ncbi:MAG: hypothetical protein WC718_19375 [Phycisphaerales bacterium]|jgi:hypothetical protein
MQTAVATTYVPNPHRERVPQLRLIRGELTYVEDRIKVDVTYRDDPIGHMHRRKMLDDVRFRAARKYQETREAMGIGTGRSPSDLREWVDGGRMPANGVTDRQRAAAMQIILWRKLIGEQAYGVLESVLIDKCRLREVPTPFDRSPGKISTLAGRVLREALMRIARDLKLAA